MVLFVIMLYLLMYFVNDDKNKGDQSINHIKYLGNYLVPS